MVAMALDNMMAVGILFTLFGLAVLWLIYFALIMTYQHAPFVNS
jgi:hypothetical protein